MKTLIVYFATVLGIAATVYARPATPEIVTDAATREWTRGNRKFTARFETVKGNTAVFSRVASDSQSGRKVGAPLNSLSKEDQKWIHDYVTVQKAEKLAAWKQARARVRQIQRARRY
jgi:hypothetical protein